MKIYDVLDDDLMSPSNDGPWTQVCLLTEVSALLDVAKKALEFYEFKIRYDAFIDQNTGKWTSLMEMDRGREAREALERMKAMENE